MFASMILYRPQSFRAVLTPLTCILVSKRASTKRNTYVQIQ